MRIQRVCKICGKTFFAIKTTQFFCSRKCFKKDYYIKTKIKKQKQGRTYPKKRCPYCQKESTLTFDPIKFPKLFKDWACPSCGITNKIMWKYGEMSNSKERIKQVLADNKILPPEPQYQIYNLPIVRPEECDSLPVILLSCEKMSILEIQRSDRKKITFS